MPLRCPSGASRIAPLISSHAPRSASSRIPLRICSSCRARLSSTWSDDRRTTHQPLRYQFLSRQLSRNGFCRYPATPVASYSTDSQFSFLTDPEEPAPRTPARRLVVLGLPTRRRSLEFSGPVTMDKEEIDHLAQTLQTFEYQVPDENVPSEILLFKPDILRVSKSRFDQLFKELNSAFLGPQIKEYLQQTNLDIAGGIARVRKKDAVNLVMREVWRVTVAEEIAAEMDVIREKELKFRAMDLFFMMVEGGTLLQQLARENRTRIILNSANNTVVLKGTKGAIETIEESLKEIPEMVVGKELDMSPLKRVGEVDKKYIPGISRLTTVFLEVEDDTMKLYGEKPDGQLNIEDAQRLLFNSLDLHLRETNSLLGETVLAKSLTGALYPVFENHTLPWMYRSRPWYRWRSVRTPKRHEEPIEHDVSETNNPLLNPIRGDQVAYTDIRTILDSPSTASDTSPATPPPPPIPENAEVETTYHAVLGQILHSSPTLPIDRDPKSLSDVLLTDPSRVLCNSVPRLIDFLSSLNPVTYTYDFKILLKFSPSPWKHPGNFELLPPVEMELHVKPETNEILGLKISAVEGHNVTDVLMPRNSCDLRFVRRRMARVEAKTGAVREYIRSAQLDVLGEDRLRAGEELVLNIPKWMVDGVKRTERWEVDEENGVTQEFVALNEEEGGMTGGCEDVNETVPTTYYFTGMETRSSTMFDFEGAPLVYSKVEGGASGGSYDEVVLQCKKDEIEYLTPLEEQSLGREDEIEAAEVAAMAVEGQKGWLEQLEELRAKRAEAADATQETKPKDEIAEAQSHESKPEQTGMEYLFGEGEEPARSTNSTVRSQSAEPITEEANEVVEEEDDSADYISNAVFQRFVTTARRLVEAVENTEMDRERTRPKKL
ncbi:hypothetical protein H072_10939 [Dactylellina haptotyla CBS 200.50]|uniref:Uncharacterized protein n=1 Tax=Dactylellina haptotyla (strain CBS 200.50) TaxID=1284197 RepID=S8B974_DACHA|nr:hypothetical protein H072_10939 [Dactylellina haptotyla CBS 200.50]